MATELDRAYVINGDDLRIALERAAIVGEEAAPRVAADILGKFAKPLGDSRWPMTRGELTTRLSLALERASIAVQKDEYHGGTVWSAGNVKTWVTPLCPGDLAAALVHDIDRQDADVAAHSRPATPVTVEQLAGWFREHKLTVTQGTGSLRAKVAAPEAIAESILEDITGQAHPMPAEAEIAEPESTSLEDPELIAIQKVCGALTNLDAAERDRALRWACSKFNVYIP